MSIVELSIVELHTDELFLTIEPPCTVDLLQTVELSIVELSILDCAHIYELFIVEYEIIELSKLEELSTLEQ